MLFERFVPPLRRVTFGSRPKSNQKVLPHASGPPAAGSLAPSLLQRPGAKGHPWPVAPFAASMRLNLLRNDSARPPERGVVRARIDFLAAAKSRLLILIKPAQPNTTRHLGPKVPSEGRAQVLWRGAFGRMPNEACWAKDGPSCRPSQRRRSEGSLAQPDPDFGCAFSLVTFCASKEVRSEAE
jgi:hypothetical protein